MRLRLTWAAATLLVGCESPTPRGEEPGVTSTREPPVLADTLALRTPRGVEIWFVSGRTARDSTGRECLERLLEIRDSQGRRGVPLLYTLEAPSLLDDSSIGARVYNHCQPGDRYRVSLGTGRPAPLDLR